MFGPLSLKDAKPLVAGSRRRVFQHPGEPELLVKVLKSEQGRPIPGLGLRRPNEMVRSFRREIGEFLRARVKTPEGPLPIARVYGVVETDLGAGLLVERISGPAGGLAPSLKTWVGEHGLDAGLERLVLALRDEILRLGIVAGDINTSNIVVAAHGPGGGRLVVVDGFGDKTFIPVHSLSGFVNRAGVRRRFARVLARLREIDAARPAAKGAISP